nr:Intraflagellar transport protein 81-like [Haemonchus contortus]
MSSESLKFIVESLNSPPFECNTSLIAFDTWPPNVLLQQLSDVISWITQTANVDISKETPDETALRILYNLKILRFKPPSDIEQLDEWRAGLVEGAKKSVYPVLLYLFSNVDMLKQRAYLAKYLIQDEIPSSLMDNEVAQLRNELAQYMERFKEVHANVLDVQQDTMLIEDIKADLKSMESEKEGLTRKIERTFKKIQNLPSLERQMAAADQLSLHKERLEQMDIQRSEQRDGVIHAEKRVQRLKDQLKELREAAEDIDPSGLIDQLKDEIATNSYLYETKLAKEIEQKRQVVSELVNATNITATSDFDINALQAEVDEKTNSIMALEQERDKGEEQVNENFSIFRHQAANVERRKNALAQKLQDARKELSGLEQHVEQKKQVLRSTSGADVMSAHQFKAYVIKVRDKKVVYKKKKAQIEEILTEREVLLRTIDLLAKKFEGLKEKIESMDGKVVDPEDAPLPARPRTAAPTSSDVEELKTLVVGLMQTLDKRSDQLAPLKKVHAEQEEALNELTEHVRNKQNDYERRRAQMEESYEEQKQLVEEMQQEENATNEAIQSLENQIAEVQSQLSTIEGEDANGGVARLKAQIEETQRQIDQLNQRTGGGTDLATARNRMAMWRGLLTMFETKLAIANDKVKQL